MEINAQPDRTDLSDVNARFARAKGVRLVIDTDAHSTRHLEFMRYGIFAARRAGLTRDDVLNTLPFDRFRAAIRKPAQASKTVGRSGTSATPVAAAPVAPKSAAAKKRGTDASASGARPARAPGSKPAARSGPRTRRSR
jgi:hypothetical protein